MRPVTFEIEKRDTTSLARVGRVVTPHGAFDTPAFMPVGTKASVKGLLPDLIRGTGSQILLNNTYHLMLRPGSDLIARRGGAHRFMNWDGPILTDSGGFQVFSLGQINQLDDDGVTFKSHLDGSLVRLTPERSIQVQNEIGADIIMAFDDCPPAAVHQLSTTTGKGLKQDALAVAEAEYERRNRIAVERTFGWLERCFEAHGRPDEQALFPICQGGTDLEMRSECAERIGKFEACGYAIGGVAVGEGPDLLKKVVEHTAPLLPEDRPRYLMGVGYARDIVMAVRSGVDMFDCVLPTRNGRNANAFVREKGQIKLRNAVFAEDDGVIEAGCDCVACGGGFSRAYVRHLFMAGEMLGPILVSLHNIRYFQRLMLDIRRAIRDDGWSLLASRWPEAGLEA